MSEVRKENFGNSTADWIAAGAAVVTAATPLVQKAIQVAKEQKAKDRKDSK